MTSRDLLLKLRAWAELQQGTINARDVRAQFELLAGTEHHAWSQARHAMEWADTRTNWAWHMDPGKSPKPVREVLALIDRALREDAGLRKYSEAELERVPF